MRVSYFYDIPIPSRKAAGIQILNTCWALAAAGVPTTVFLRELRGEPADCLAYYGLAPHPNLTLRPFFARPEWRLFPPWALSRVLAEKDGCRWHIIISRGETGLMVAPWLQRMGWHEMFFVYEAHRLCFAHALERLSGRRWDETMPLAKPFRRMLEREKAAVEGADAIICLTEGMHQALTQLFNITQPSLILPSGTSIPEDDAKTRTGEQDIDVVYVGKLIRRKGLPLLMEAMRHLPGYRLCVVGDLSEKSNVSPALARRDELEPRIEFTGFVEPRSVPDYIARARVGVCPLEPDASIVSERFTSPLKLLELMAHEVPVVASDLPVTRAIVSDRESALLVRPGDPLALAHGIQTLLDDRVFAQRLAKAARNRVMAFSWAERARRLREFLEELVQQRRSSPRAAKRIHG